MSLQRTAFGLARGVRKFSNSPVVKSGDVHPGYKKIKPIQERFCVEDGNPVHLKGGAFDNILYRVTMALCVGAVAWDCKLYYDLAQR